jgi:hypothetical protein
MRALLCSIVLATLGQLAAAPTVPPDFELKARFFPGGSWTPGSWNPWNLTIHPDGTALQDTSVVGTGTDRHVVKKIQLSQAAVAEILSAFREAHFFNLPKKLTKPIAEHQMGVSLKLTLDGHSHVVTFSVPAKIRDRAAARRFRRAWRVVAAKIPSTNKNREFDYWFQHNPL